MWTGLHNKLSALYHTDCPDCKHVQLAQPDRIDEGIFYAAVKKVFERGGYASDLLTDQAVKTLFLEIEKSLGKSLQKIAEKVPEEMIGKLKRDLFIFSGCKTATELREATSFLIDDQGKVRDWPAFKEQMTKLHKQYNVAYLEAEYDFAIQSGDMVERWANFEQGGDRYNLQYRTANDESVRDTHRGLHNITLPFDDSFWNDYTPPNGWGCRCTVVQVLKDKYPSSDPEGARSSGEDATTEIDKQGRNRLEMFRFNPYKDEVIFPQNHPYYKFRGDISNE